MRPLVLPEACQPPDIWRIIDGLGAAERETVLFEVAHRAPEAFEAALLHQQAIRDRRRAAVWTAAVDEAWDASEHTGRQGGAR